MSAATSRAAGLEPVTEWASMYAGIAALAMSAAFRMCTASNADGMSSSAYSGAITIG